MKKADQLYFKSIELGGQQLVQAYLETKALKLPKSYLGINKVVVVGMGGSQLSIDLIKALFSDRLKYPIIQVRGYRLPSFVDDKTLIILSSYSGGTEEVLSVVSEVKKKKYKALIISSGGKLASLAKEYKIPAYIFRPVNNPSKQPRMGTNYITGAVIRTLKNLNVLKITDNEVNNISDALTKSFDENKQLLRYLLVRLTKVEENAPFRFHEALVDTNVRVIDTDADPVSGDEEMVSEAEVVDEVEVPDTDVVEEEKV